MAVITPTMQDISPIGDKSAIVMTWTPVTENDTFSAFDCSFYRIDAVEFSGTFGSATAVLQGAVLSTYAGLKDLAGAAISKTAAGWSAVLEQPRYVKPVASGGSGQSLTATLLLRKVTSPFK